jgi:hypothetical protein
VTIAGANPEYRARAIFSAFAAAMRRCLERWGECRKNCSGTVFRIRTGNRQGTHTTDTPFEKLNVAIVQNVGSALRYQTW